MAPIGTQTQNCFSRVRSSAGLSIPGRDTYYNLCRVVYLFVHCALNVIFHFNSHKNLKYFPKFFQNFKIILVKFKNIF